MSDEARTARKRVRTGCLTCRRRKRKCDEARPNCENCKSKGLVCHYGTNFTFVAPKGYRATGGNRPATSNASPTSNTPNTSILACDNAVVQTTSNDRPSYETDDLTAHWTQSLVPQETADLFHTGTDQIDSADEPHPVNEIGIEQTIDWNVTGIRADTHDTVQEPEQRPVVEQRLQHPQLSQNEHRHKIPVYEGINTTQDEHELALLHHYRYNIATMLDLGLGDSYYGIQVMMNARKSLAIHNAILAVSNRHWTTLNGTSRLVNDVSRTRIATDMYTDIRPASSESLTRLALTAASILLNGPPGSWLEDLHETVSRIAGSTVIYEHRPLLARLILAALITTSSRGQSELISWFLQDKMSIFGDIGAEAPQHELQVSLALLAESCRLLPDCTQYGNQLLQSWQSCWEKLGDWFQRRTVQMREILQLPDTTDIQSRDERVFPFILFSSGCSTVANVAYHLASLQMLRNKPRLLKPSARCGSPISSLVHAQRLLGVAGAAVDAGIWDPLIAVATLYAARGLSHYKQLKIAVHILQKMIKISGMKLGDLVDELKPAETRSSSQHVMVM